LSAILDRDRQILDAIAAGLDELWKPMRFLADLHEVWPELSEDERADIEASRPYRDQYHRRLAEAKVAELRRLSAEIHAHEHQTLRDRLEQFLRHWDAQEPDQARILSALVRQASA